jgi:hypothetical protein
MAAAAHNIKSIVGKNHAMSPRSFPLIKEIDFAAYNVGAAEDAAFVTIKGGTLVRSAISILETPEGAAATATVGTEADPDLMGTINLNATAGTVAPAVAALAMDASAAYVEAEAQAIADKVDAVIARLGTSGLAGWYFSTDTEIRITPDADVDLAKLRVVFDCVTFD